MIKFGKLAIVALAISVMFMGLSSCKKAEESGKDMEKVGEETTEKVEKPAEKKAEEPVTKLEKTVKDVKGVMKK